MEKHDGLTKLKSVVDQQAHEHQFAVTYKDRKFIHIFVTATNNYNIHTSKELTVYCWLCLTEKQCFHFYFTYKTIDLN